MILYDFEKKFTKYLLKMGDLRNRGDKKGLVNMHRLNTENSGDLMSAPYLYFPKLREKSSNVDVIGYLSKNDILAPYSWVSKIRNKNIILGGGGLLDRDIFSTTMEILEHLQLSNNKVVLWGVGHNNPNLEVNDRYYRQLKSFELVGVRDYDIENITWVPCVSCMHEIFDQEFIEGREVGVVEHESIPIPNLKNYPEVAVLKNKSKFEDIVRFIGESRRVVTNSYHVMYWSILMKKKVVVIPNSSKMYSFKYKVPFFSEMTDIEKMFEKSFTYDGVLNECRDINMSFSKKVFDYLNL